MQPIFYLFYGAALTSRLVALAVSLRHEKRLRVEGAREFGRRVSGLFVIAWLGIFAGSLVETAARHTTADGITVLAIAIWLLSMVALLAVIRALGPLWTFKILIAEGHTVVRSGPFRFVKHPNYYFNLLPEVFAIPLAGHAWLTLALGFPVYAIAIAVRIRQEERAMRELVPTWPHRR